MTRSASGWQPTKSSRSSVTLLMMANWRSFAVMTLRKSKKRQEAAAPVRYIGDTYRRATVPRGKPVARVIRNRPPASGERSEREADDGIRTHDLRHGKATL